MYITLKDMERANFFRKEKLMILMDIINEVFEKNGWSLLDMQTHRENTDNTALGILIDKYHKIVRDYNSTAEHIRKMEGMV